MILGAEALARWNCPGKGFLTPNAFGADLFASEEGMKLDLYMFESVCQKLEEWQMKGWEDLSLSCNFARFRFSDFLLAEKLISIAEKYRFCRDRLIIEVTEDLVEETRFVMRRILYSLKDFGFRIALDDFGAYGSSIRDIQMLPLDILKLDRSLIRNSWTPTGEAVLKELTRMAKRLKLMTVCEGVETDLDMQIARRTRVDAVQGFLYHIPLPEQEADRLLEQYLALERII